MTVTDLFTKFAFAKTFPAQNAEAVAKYLVLEVFLRYGVPQKVLTDQGITFVNRLTTEIYMLFNVKRLTTSGCHPQTMRTVQWDSCHDDVKIR